MGIMDTESILIKGGIERIIVNYVDDSKKKFETETLEKNTNTVARTEPIDLKNEEIRETVDRYIEEINEVIAHFNTKVQFAKDDDTGKTVIKIIDRDTDKTIKMIPPEVFLKVAAKMAEMIGILVDEKI